MSLQLLKSLMEELSKEKSLCNWARLYSCLIWQKLQFCKKVGVRLSETTITQDLVFQFHLMASERAWPVKLYESLDEEANGNDLEIFIETKQGYVLFAAQAKSLYRSKKYEKISHSTSGKEQIDTLLKYAQSRGAISIYLFYNYLIDTKWNSEIFKGGRYNLELYGTSFSSAQFIKTNYHKKVVAKSAKKAKRKRSKWRWKIPSFHDLHPVHGLPFHCLFCDLKEKPVADWPDYFSDISDEVTNLTFYSEDEITDEFEWRDLSPAPAIGKIPLETKDNDDLLEIGFAAEYTDLNTKSSFNPKFRLVFSDNLTQETKIIRLE